VFGASSELASVIEFGFNLVATDGDRFSVCVSVRPDNKAVFDLPNSNPDSD